MSQNEWPKWLYRKGEAQIFASPEDVPDGQGWVDSPALVEDTPEIVEEPVKPVRKRKVTDDNDA